MAAPISQLRGIDDIKVLEQTSYEDRNCERTVYELVKSGATIKPERIAFYNLPSGDPNEEAELITYREFLSLVHQAANLFNQLGVGPKDVVAVLLPILPANIVAMMGAVTAGILCPINWMLEADHIAGILNAVKAKVIVALAPTDGYEIWHKVELVQVQVKSLKHVLQVALPGQGADNAQNFERLLEGQNGAGLDFEYDASTDDIAVYAHTGGTTGLPKLAQLRHGAFAYKCWAYTELLENKPEHVVFAGSPLFHIGGIVYHTVNALAHGSTSLMVGPAGFRNKAIIDNYWQLVEKYQITDLFGVPTTLTALANVPVAEADISTLRPYTMTGSTGLPIEVSRYFEEEIGVRILCNYGMTENTATIALPPRNGEPRFGSSGVRLPYTQVRIVELDSENNIIRDCDTDEIGSILVKGPGVFPGYLDDRINAEVFLADGWFHTGDLGRFDEDEYLWVTGRSKDVIIRSGHNIDPLVIEDALRKHADVALAGAVGQPDAYAGELPVVYVQLKPGRQTKVSELAEIAAQNIPERAAVPKEIRVIDQMPLTAVGKIFKPELRKMAAAKVFTEVLVPLKETPSSYAVEMQDHAKYGMLCKIHITPVDDVAKAKAAELVDQITSGFTVKFEIEWPS
ncbi:MAG: acyl-CoA synthetase [Rhodospirillaceae bacterium]|nr:acyl-CoA synthetase [Rhodospirillaceae bacterium]